MTTIINLNGSQASSQTTISQSTSAPVCHGCGSEVKRDWSFCGCCGTILDFCLTPHEYDRADYPDDFDPELYNL